MINQKKALAITKALQAEVSESSFRNYVKQRVVTGIGEIEGKFSSRGVSALYPDCSPYEAAVASVLLKRKGRYGYGLIRIARKIAMFELKDSPLNLYKLEFDDISFEELGLDLEFDKDTGVVINRNNDVDTPDIANLGEAFDVANEWLKLYIAFRTAATRSGKWELHYAGEKELQAIALQIDAGTVEMRSNEEHVELSIGDWLITASYNGDTPVFVLDGGALGNKQIKMF